MVKFLRKYHKWIGIISIFFVLMFCVSGVLLNHRKVISAYGIPRPWLPEKYHFKNWNNGAVKGTLKVSSDSILMYGASGVWLTDTLCQNITPCHKGMLDGIENRSLRALVKTASGKVFGVSTYELYQLDKDKHEWSVLSNHIASEAAFSDLAVKNDTLFVVSRSHIFQSTPPYQQFTQLQLPAASNYKPKVSLFKTMWVLHSGELFGLAGKLVVDAIGIIIIIITLTGLALTILRVIVRKRKKRNREVATHKKAWKWSMKWHNKLGIGFFVMLLIIVLTGMFLRPPLLIAIIRSKVKPVPYSTLDSKNPWNEKLRVLRYDEYNNNWLLYSSDGFYRFADFSSQPTPIRKKPPTSVMGITVLEAKDKNVWLVGSFSGLYWWNAENGITFNALTGQRYKPKRSFGPPVMSNPINGYSDDFANRAIAFDYSKGAIPVNNSANIPPMPNFIQRLPMSLWNVALEIHVGRMYTFLGVLGGFFIFLSGLLFLFVLISGYIVYKKRHKKRKRR